MTEPLVRVEDLHVTFVTPDRTVHAVEAGSEHEIRERLAQDPWSESHLVVDSIDAWTIRLQRSP